ncbi:MAG: family 16 glycoside hydrolase [Candidatus Aminicenantales bacterium]
MNRRIAAVVLAVFAGALLAAGPLAAAGQDVSAAGSQDLKARVSSIIGRFPAENSAARDALCADLVKLGPAALGETCTRVLPPGSGDDSKARFAVNGLAVYVTRAGAEAERLLFARTLLAALAAKPDKQVASFVMTQLQLAGKRESVKPLAGFLKDDALAGPAAAALQAIGSPEAARALLRGLGTAAQGARISIVDALGELRSREAVKKLLPLAESGDEGLRRAARFALANIGDPAAAPALTRVRVASSQGERAQAPGLYLLFARRLAESGKTTEALAAARSILDSHNGPGESQVASDALTLLVSILKDKAVPDLLGAVDSPVPAFRGAALEMAATVGKDDTTARWVEKASASTPEVRAGIIGMLGRRGDKTALPFVRESLKSNDEIVRLAAIPAAVRLGGEAVLPDLFALIGSGDEKTVAALKTSLLGFDGRRVVPEAVRLLDTTPLPGKAVLVDIIGEKGAKPEIDRVFALASDPEPATRAAALGALAKLAGEENLPRLVDMLEKATDGDDIVRLQDAVAAAELRDAAPARRGAALVDLLKDAAPARKAVILRVLPEIGGALAMRAAAGETENQDSQVRTAAVYALSRWPDFAAAGDLLRIATTTASKRYRLLAVDGYARLVGQANMLGQRKLALFQDLLAKPFDDSDKKAVVTGAASIREPEALRLLASCLDNPALGETAAAGALELASEQAPQERWLSGHEAISVLRRIQARTAGGAEYERIGALIAQRLRQGGFVPLFDGRGFDGWKGLVADPPARTQMSPQELAKAQGEADDRMRAHWKVVDGVLVFDGQGESLCTASDYGDFELLVDWKIEKGGDSGLYLRGSPQVQIWDPDANPVGSGGLYNNQKGKSVPLEKADRPVGEWNSFRVIMIGDRVSVYLNDKLVVDNTILENYWERDKPIYPTGQIELQAHGNRLYFRNIFIREIPRDPAMPQMTQAEADEGFAPLFNARDLDGWTGDTKGYAAEDGKIVIHPELGSGNLYTAKEYADFVLRFEFKLTPAANNGLGVRAPLEGDAAYAGMEIQILEDGSPVYWGLRPYQYHGSIYGVVAARRGFLRPPGEWNAEEVTVKGRRVRVVVNGSTAVDADLDAASAGGTIDGNEHPGLKRESGHIGFLGHGSIVEFRNLRLKEIR